MFTLSQTVEVALPEPVRIDGGWRVRETGHYWIDVMVMMFGNTRIVTTPKATPDQYERGWCYQGPLAVTILRCGTFNPDAGEEPEGWVKEAGTDRRPCGSLFPPRGEHRAYVAACPACGGETR